MFRWMYGFFMIIRCEKDNEIISISYKENRFLKLKLYAKLILKKANSYWNDKTKKEFLFNSAFGNYIDCSVFLETFKT